MLFKKIISGITIFLFAYGAAGLAQEDEISDDVLTKEDVIQVAKESMV